jgi:hypothetical protein
MRDSSSPLGHLLLAARSSRRVPAIAAMLDIPDIRVVPVPAIPAAILDIPNICVVPAVPASSTAGRVWRRAGGGRRGC